LFCAHCDTGKMPLITSFCFEPALIFKNRDEKVIRFLPLINPKKLCSNDFGGFFFFLYKSFISKYSSY
jgi:hypothetical protein